MSPELSLVVLHYNRWDLTKDCLASIDAQEIPCTYEKVLVDNGSTEPLPEVPAGWRVVRYEENRGHIVGQNRCFESARGEWVLFVANDVRFRPSALRNLLLAKYGSRTTQPLLITPKGMVDNAGLFWKWPGYGISREPYHPLEPNAVTSTCYLMRKDIWEEVGGFDENLTSSYEDIDMGLRLEALGYRVQANPDARALHLGNATLRYQPSRTRAAFHRDRVYVVKKHYHGPGRWLRLLVIGLLDSLPRLERNCNHPDNHSTPHTAHNHHTCH